MNERREQEQFDVKLALVPYERGSDPPSTFPLPCNTERRYLEE